MTDLQIEEFARHFGLWAVTGVELPKNSRLQNSKIIGCVRAAVAAEREACEKLLDDVGAVLQTEDRSDEYWSGVGAMVEAGEVAIRKRSNVK